MCLALALTLGWVVVCHHELSLEVMMVPVGSLPGCDFPQQCWILPVSPLVHGVLLVVLEVLLGNAVEQPLGAGVPGSGEVHGYPCECCRNGELEY